MFNGKNILITGGTGFFGRLYVENLLKNYKPERLIVYSRSEAMQAQMQSTFSDECMRYFIGDVRDYDRLEDALDGVDFVVHAASMKYINSTAYNPFEAIKTNVQGSENLIRASLKRRVKKVIALSVDRVQFAQSLSDATRLTSEKLFISANNIVGSRDTRFSVVRLNTLQGDDQELISYFNQAELESDRHDCHKNYDEYIQMIKKSVSFTLKNLERMQGGEVFIPKLMAENYLTSYNCETQFYFDLLNSGVGTYGLESERILDFQDHYVVCPDVQFANKSDYSKNMLGEKGQTIAYGRHSINQHDIEAVVRVLRSDYLTQGDMVPKFESVVADYIGVKYSVAVNSATSALHLACLALGLNKDDILWTSPNTFVASANCGLYCGAKIDFVDIDQQTYNICVDKLEEKLIQAKLENKLPKIVVPVHFAGQSCDMRRIHQLAQEYEFKIIEDASHAIGGKYLDQPIGGCQYSDITVFSFHPVKIITTAEGGMATTNSPELAEKMNLLRSHGVTRDPKLMTKESEGGWYYQQVDLGFNYRMTEMQAALGVSQMSRLDDFVAQRHQLQKRYHQLLVDLPLVVPHQFSDSYSALHLYPIKVELEQVSKSHAQIFGELRASGLGVNLHYIPVHTQPYYQQMGFKVGDFPNAEHYYSRAISIPLFHGMTIEQQDEVVRVLAEVLV